MEHKKIGYIAIQFTAETNQEVAELARNLTSEDLVTATIDGKTEGGNVTDKLHFTLFYGLNDEMLDKDELSGFLDKIKLKEIEINGFGLFPIKEYDCNALYLKVKDVDNELKKIHEKFEKFPHFSEYQKFEYTPHITIAYVKKDFNLEAFTQNLPEILCIDKVYYALSSALEV